MVGQSDQRHRRNDRSRGSRILLLHERFVLLTVPIVADPDDAGIFAEVHTGGDSFARYQLRPFRRFYDRKCVGRLRWKRKVKGKRVKAKVKSQLSTFSF